MRSQINVHNRGAVLTGFRQKATRINRWLFCNTFLFLQYRLNSRKQILSDFRCHPGAFGYSRLFPVNPVDNLL